MNRLSLPGPILESAWNGKSQVQVVTLYEDLQTGMRAKKFYDDLARQYRNGCHFSHQMWEFDTLRFPQLHAESLRESAEADLVLISTRGKEPLPKSIRHWLEEWLKLERNSCPALAVLVDQDSTVGTSQHGTQEFLRNLAERRQVHYRWFPVNPAADCIGFSGRPTSHHGDHDRHRHGKPNQTLNFRRTGINE